MSAPVRQRLLALGCGAACHGAFLAAIATMARGLLTGMATGWGSLHGAAAVAADGLLLLQFPILHSLLLTRRGTRVLGALGPAGVGRTLASTTYVLLASLQVGATFLWWSPSGIVLWRPTGPLLGAHLLAFAASWAFLARALCDAGLGLQTGWLGWTAVWRGSTPRYPDLPRGGLFARCRQPIYLGFALVLWTAPVWTPDRLAIAIAWGLYCAVGPLHKERRFATLYGRDFEDYRRRVPYLVPRLFP